MIVKILQVMVIVQLLGHAQATHPLLNQGCQSNDQCLSDGWEYCHVEKQGDKQVGVCKHKDHFPLKELEFWGWMAMIAIMGITQTGGIAGAGAQVPFMMIFFKFDAKNAIALSNFSIFGGSFVRWIVNSQQPHPLKNGTGILVDMNLAILMLPMIVSGVSIGVILGIILPNIVCIISYAVALSYFGRGVSLKAYNLYKKESEAEKPQEKEIEMQGGQQEQKEQPVGADSGSKLVMCEAPVQPVDAEQLASVEKQQVQSEEQNEKLKAIIAYESSNLQWKKVFLNWGLIVALIVISLLRGATTREESLMGILRCETIDWVMFIVLQVVCLIFLVIGIFVLKKDYKDKKEAGYKFIPGDLEATPKNLAHMIGIAFFGAIYCTYSGLGAGMMFCPALIIIGIEARIATATGMYVTMFLTMAASIQYIIFKRINLEYGLYVQFTTLVGTLLGLFFQRYIIKTYKRVSYTNFFFLFGLFTALFSAVIINIPILIHKNELGEPAFALSEYCPA